MISLLTGKIVGKGPESATILTSGGVGYSVRMSPLQLAGFEIGKEISIPTFLKVSDSALELFGFESHSHRAFFSLLISVKSVGPKSAMHILSLGSIDQIQSAIARGDVDYLTAVQGMGKKTAERIVVELKSKVNVGDPSNIFSGDSTILSEVVDGLIAMGYSKDDAKATVQALDSAEKTTEQLLREALKMVSGR